MKLLIASTFMMDKWCCTVDGSEIHLSNVEKPLQIVEIKLQGGPLLQRNQWELIDPSTYILTFLWRYAQNSTACFIYISFQLTTMCFCCVEFPYLCQIRQTINMNILHWHWHVSGKNQYNSWTWIKGWHCFVVSTPPVETKGALNVWRSKRQIQAFCLEKWNQKGTLHNLYLTKRWDYAKPRRLLAALREDNLALRCLFHQTSSRMSSPLTGKYKFGTRSKPRPPKFVRWNCISSATCRWKGISGLWSQPVLNW